MTPEINTRLQPSTDLGSPIGWPWTVQSLEVTTEGGKTVELGRGSIQFYSSARRTGKSVMHLMGTKKVDFAAFRRAFTRTDGTLLDHVSAPGAIERRFDLYERNWALANPHLSQDPSPTVDPSKQKGNE